LVGRLSTHTPEYREELYGWTQEGLCVLEALAYLEVGINHPETEKSNLENKNRRAFRSKRTKRKK